MQVRTDIRPGDIGQIVYLHGTLYAAEYDIDPTFEGYVAAALGEFVKNFDERKDRLWVVESNEKIFGSIAVAGLPDRIAQLRWFLLHPDARGSGLGRRLVREAVEFCRDGGFETAFLWTISELKIAAHLYREAGFRLSEEKTEVIWGRERTQQRYDLKLNLNSEQLP